jgi:DNA-binding XRE family transcriptional regulator
MGALEDYVTKLRFLRNYLKGNKHKWADIAEGSGVSRFTMYNVINDDYLPSHRITADLYNHIKGAKKNV